VCIKTTLIEGLDKYEDQIKRKNIKVDLEIPKEMTIHTDPGIFRTIIHNLLSNCAEYTPADGSITIKANNNSIDNVLCISNNVKNMTAEIIPNLFERFWRADDSRSDSSHIGLGLSLTRACANALSLGLNVELSEDNKSIHFTLSYQDKEIFKPSSSGNV
jgi:signal transduction histidine kinase